MPAYFINESLVPVARSQDVLIVHPHAQRTGGSALRTRLFIPVFGKERVYLRMFIPNAKRWSRLNGRDLEAYRVYADLHNFVDIGLRRPFVCVALLRDPVYRALSLYHAVKRLNGHFYQDLANRLGPEDFFRIASRKNPLYFCNVQCRRICGQGNARKALAAIQRYYIGVGFTPHLPEFVRALCELFDWPPTELKSRPADAEKYGSQVSPEFRDLVLRTNREDQDLFEIMVGASPHAPAPASLGRIIRIWGSELNGLSIAALRRLTGGAA